MKFFLVVILSAFASGAWAECACFCAAGELRTMCTTVEEAQENPTLCASYSSASCPVEAEQGAAETYQAPSQGAVNCRSMRIYDGLQGAYVDGKVCDVEPTS